MFSVSMAEASRRASFWLSLVSTWSRSAWRARSADATWSRRQPSWAWLANTAITTAPTAATPHEPSRHIMRGDRTCFSSAKSPENSPPVSLAPKASASGSESFAMNVKCPVPVRLPKSIREH